MKIKTNKIILVMVSFFLIGPWSQAADSNKKSVHEIMLGIEDVLHGLEAPSLATLKADQVADQFSQLKNLFEELKGLYRPQRNGTNEEWLAFCGDAQKCVDAMETAWRNHDDAGYSKSCTALLNVREEAHKKFRPGFLTILKRLFSKSK